MDIKKIIEVLSFIKKAHYQAYLVGGSSRDFLLGRNFKDIDIATNAPIHWIIKNFKVENDDGLSMGSIKIVYHNLLMEITQFREEEYTEKSSFPKIKKFLQTPEEDAQRRDFTINALYLDLTNQEIIDPFEGIKDLFTYQIRFIGHPATRIKEDPSRILRGLRLSQKLNFQIEENTKEAFFQFQDELQRLSKNKLKKEIEKMKEDIGEIKTNFILNQYHLTNLIK